MDAEEARQVAAALKRLGIPGVVALEDPAAAARGWRVYDSSDPETRRDTTAEALAALAAHLHEAPEPPRQAERGPTRGFVMPPADG